MRGYRPSAKPPHPTSLRSVDLSPEGRGEESARLPTYPNTFCNTPFFTTTVLSTVIVVFITGRSKWPAV